MHRGQNRDHLEISKATLSKAQHAKQYIEKKYGLNKQKQQHLSESWKNFHQQIMQLNITIQEQHHLKKQIVHQQMNELRKKRQKISKKNFQSIAVIGRGAFGEVRLCKEVKTNRIVAVKCLNKKEMLKKNQEAHVKTQRNILSESIQSEWIVKLYSSFQDRNFLYLVMEFLQGGDLMTLLIEKNILDQEAVRFYISQIILALQDVHKLGYIHRDLKPDNILIGRNGHIKISDFGLCKKSQMVNQTFNIQRKSKKRNMSKSPYKPEQFLKNLHQIKRNEKNVNNKRKKVYSAVGTPDYIPPQMLRRVHYTQKADCWSLGILIYEMLIGFAPFTAQKNQDIYYKIENYQQFLYFAPESQNQLSQEVIDLIKKLLVEQKSRLSLKQIKGHPWFKTTNWNEVSKKNTLPPFIPKVKDQLDIKYFDKYEQKEPWNNQKQQYLQTMKIIRSNTSPTQDIPRKDFNFIGYSYKQQQQQNDIFEKVLDKFQRDKSEEMRRDRQFEEMMNINMKKHKQKYSKEKENHSIKQSSSTSKTMNKNIISYAKIISQIQKLHQTQKSQHKKYNNDSKIREYSNINQSKEKWKLMTEIGTQRGKNLSPFTQRDCNIKIYKKKSEKMLATQKYLTFFKKSNQNGNFGKYLNKTLSSKLMCSKNKKSKLQ